MIKLKLQQFGDVTTDAETNLIKAAQMVKVREVDFVNRFNQFSLTKLIEALGVTRKIPLIEGTSLYVYKTVGTLQSGDVPEGEIIPLSQYERTKEQIGEITIQKWRKAVSAEAIKKSGYNEAVNTTDTKMLQDIQTGIRTNFFNFLNGLNGTVVGADTLQAVLAKTWGQLKVLFENDSVEVVHFINPLTIADYLATATITMQTAFGMNYIEDFLGMGTVIMNSNIPKGHVISTAKENIIMYYLSMNGEVAQAFNLTTDESGYIGVHASQTDNRVQLEMIALSGIQFLVEYADGVVLGQIDSTPTLGSVTVTSDQTGASSGQSHISTSNYSLGTGEKFVYKTAKTTAPAVTYGQKLSGWTDLPSGGIITPTATHDKITVAAVDSNGRAQAAGNQTLSIKS
jgi:hypothetical protein